MQCYSVLFFKEKELFNINFYDDTFEKHIIFYSKDLKRKFFEKGKTIPNSKTYTKWADSKGDRDAFDILLKYKFDFEKYHEDMKNIGKEGKVGAVAKPLSPLANTITGIKKVLKSTPKRVKKEVTKITKKEKKNDN